MMFKFQSNAYYDCRMTKRHSRTRLALIFCIFFPLAVRAEQPFGGAMQGFGDVRHHILGSESLDRDFHLFVRLPEGYVEGDVEKLPTIYLLDGGITFPLMSGFYRYLTLAGEVPAAILVGIGYGTDNWQNGNLRSTDYTAPSEEREHYGGASRFQEVLRKEVMPLIERTYRSDPARRVIFGQSLGGQFVLHAALTAPDLFWGHIASNPALHRNLPFFLERRENASDQGSDPPRERIRLFVSSAEYDDERFAVPARRWMEHWSAHESKPWALKTMVIRGENHFSAAPASFRQGMLWLFGDPDE
jgi:predicted alpha/beta superfamily hydrolase